MRDTQTRINNAAKPQNPPRSLDRPAYSSGISMSPLLTWSMTSCGGWPSIVHPTDCAVPRISFTVPARVLASERGRITRAILIISSRGMFPVCLIFFSFFRSRGGSERNELAALTGGRGGGHVNVNTTYLLERE